MSNKGKVALLNVYKRNRFGNVAGHRLSDSTLHFAELEHRYSYIRLLNRGR
jgi:hypothetical protein